MCEVDICIIQGVRKMKKSLKMAKNGIFVILKYKFNIISVTFEKNINFFLKYSCLYKFL